MSFDILATIVQMADEKKIIDPALAEFYEARKVKMADTMQATQIARKILTTQASIYIFITLQIGGSRRSV